VNAIFASSDVCARARTGKSERTRQQRAPPHANAPARCRAHVPHARTARTARALARARVQGGGGGVRFRVGGAARSTRSWCTPRAPLAARPQAQRPSSCSARSQAPHAPLCAGTALRVRAARAAARSVAAWCDDDRVWRGGRAPGFACAAGHAPSWASAPRWWEPPSWRPRARGTGVRKPKEESLPFARYILQHQKAAPLSATQRTAWQLRRAPGGGRHVAAAAGEAGVFDCGAAAAVRVGSMRRQRCCAAAASRRCAWCPPAAAQRRMQPAAAVLRRATDAGAVRGVCCHALRSWRSMGPNCLARGGAHGASRRRVGRVHVPSKRA
jgi:hypothetical protein